MSFNLTTKGQFTAGTVAGFYFSFSDTNGDLFDPSEIEVIIYDPDGAEVETFTALDKLSLGYFLLEWSIPSSTASGLYSIQTQYTVEEEDGPEQRSITESFIIGEQEIGYIPEQLVAYRTLLESLIGYTQRIPVFDEVGRLNREKTVADFSFERWNQPSGVIVRINGDRKTDSFEVDYLKGKVSFTYPLSSADEVTAKYTFRWFTDDELENFLTQSIQIFNQYAPQSAYNIVNLPLRYGITVAEQAAVFAIRRLLMDILYQEPAKVFGGMERADRIMGNLESLKKNYEEELKALYQEKKKQPYVGLTKTVTTPMFTLPGGRSRWFRMLFKG